MGKGMEHEIILDFSEIFRILKKRFMIIILITTLAALASAVFSRYVMTPVYVAESSIIIGKEQENHEVGYSYSYNDVMMYEKMLKTYGEIAKSRLVAKLAGEKLKKSGREDLSFGGQEVTVTPCTDTQILIIKIQDINPNSAMIKVNTLAQTFVEEANRIYPSCNVQVLDAAILPVSPVSPKTRLNMTVAFLLGIMVSLGIICIIEYMDNTLKTEEDIEKYVGFPVIGSIPKEPRAFR